MKLEIGMPVVFKKPEDRYSKYAPLMYTSDMDEYSKGTIIEIDTDGDVRLDECPGYFWCEQWIDKKATKELWDKLFKDNVKVGMTVWFKHNDGSVVTRAVTALGESCFSVDSIYTILYDNVSTRIKLRKTLSSWGWDKLGKVIERDAGVLTDPVKKVEVFVPPKKHEEVPFKMEPMEMPTPTKVTYDCEYVSVPRKDLIAMADILNSWVNGGNK